MRFRLFQLIIRKHTQALQRLLLRFHTDEGKFIDDRADLSAEDAALLDIYEMLAYNYYFDREQGDEFFEGIAS